MYVLTHRPATSGLIVLLLILFAPLQGRLRLQVPRSSRPKDRVSSENRQPEAKIPGPMYPCFKAPCKRGMFGASCSLKSRRSAVTVLNALWHGSNEPEALRNEPEALRKTRNDKTGGRGQLSSPRALPGVPAPSRRVNRDSYITVWLLARTFLWSVLEPRAVLCQCKAGPWPRNSLL